MGKHEAPVPPVKAKIHVIMRLCTHHGMHVAGAVVLHIIAFIVATPVLTSIGSGGTH